MFTVEHQIFHVHNNMIIGFLVSPCEWWTALLVNHYWMAIWL